MDAVTATFTPGTNAADAQAYREALGLADSTAIVTYLEANTVINTTSGAPDSEHSGEITIS
jgi:hypothetical protein